MRPKSSKLLQNLDDDEGGDGDDDDGGDGDDDGADGTGTMRPKSATFWRSSKPLHNVIFTQDSML